MTTRKEAISQIGIEITVKRDVLDMAAAGMPLLLVTIAGALDPETTSHVCGAAAAGAVVGFWSNTISHRVSGDPFDFQELVATVLFSTCAGATGATLF